MAEPYIGEIRAFGFNFAPYNWAFCQGQLLPISQYQALFSIIGTTFGGNGTSNFGLPNLQGRAPMHWGSGPGFNTVWGEPQGSTTITLTSAQIPGHKHVINAADPGAPGERGPMPTDTSYLGTSGASDAAYKKVPSNFTPQFSPKAISNTGSSLAHENMQPYQCINFCIALNGIYPSRN